MGPKNVTLTLLKENNMRLFEREMRINQPSNQEGLIDYLRVETNTALMKGDIPIRFVVTNNQDHTYHCELGLLTGGVPSDFSEDSIFAYRQRQHENTNQFTAVLLVPTGIGAEIGGHSGDAAPVARLLASACDTLITHPNVVNASDIIELPENGLYIEGSVISRLMMGMIRLQKVRANRILLVIEDHEDVNVANLIINSASAARAALGIDCLIVKMKDLIRMETDYASSGSAVGEVKELEKLYEILQKYRSQYDAVALSSIINVPGGYHMEYFQSKGTMVNPWGGVEAMLTHAVSMLFNVPSAHAPMVESMGILNLNPGIVDPRMAAEAVSCSYLHCVLKGLHKSPRILTEFDGSSLAGTLGVENISCLIIPDGCIGLPTLAALEQGIPVIAVRENRNKMQNDLKKLPFRDGKLFIVDNYLEAVGVMTALKAGVALPSVRRPLAATSITLEPSDKKVLKKHHSAGLAACGEPDQTVSAD